MNIHRFAHPEELALQAAGFICDLAQKRIARTGRFSLVLAGGSTPAATYRQLIDRAQLYGLDWSCVEVFWGDERCVAPDHEQSNYRMARENLLDMVPIPEQNIFRMACEGDPAAGAERYEKILRSRFPGQPLPSFDLILLGLGDDGHTASLFTNTEILNERERLVASLHLSHLDSWRISLTLPVINAAHHVAFLVTGRGKAGIVKHIFQDDLNTTMYPARMVDPQGEISWFLDQDAGSLIAKRE